MSRHPALRSKTKTYRMIEEHLEKQVKLFTSLSFNQIDAGCEEKNITSCSNPSSKLQLAACTCSFIIREVNY